MHQVYLESIHTFVGIILEILRLTDLLAKASLSNLHQYYQIPSILSNLLQLQLIRYIKH